MEQQVAGESNPVAASVAKPQSKRELVAERVRTLVALLKDDKPVCEALREAGYPEAQVKKGWEAVPQRVIEFLIEQGVKFERIGEVLIKAPGRMEKRVIGAMHERMISGAKDGVNAAKILTQHKSIANQFVQDAQANVLVIQAPAEWKPTAAEPRKVIDATPPTETELPDYE